MIKIFSIKAMWLVLAVLISILTAPLKNMTEAQTPFKDPIAAKLSKKQWKVIDGFRSAKFGMTEKQVLQAIAKDFKVSKIKVEKKVNVAQKTKSLIIHLPKLMKIGGPSDIVYILGYKSKRLAQVNIDWGTGISKSTPPQEIVNVANLLRNHFIKKRYKKEGYATNLKFTDNKMVVFRGLDKKGRMILLRLAKDKGKEGNNKKAKFKNVSVVLSYILDAKKPDTRQGKQ